MRALILVDIQNDFLPGGALAVPDGEGGVDIYVATQWLHVDRDQVAPCLGLEKEQVRIHLAGVGGAAGMAVLGVLALGTAPADAPTVDRRAPVADLDRVTPQPGEGSSVLLPVGRGIRP